MRIEDEAGPIPRRAWRRVEHMTLAAARRRFGTALTGYRPGDTIALDYGKAGYIVLTGGPSPKRAAVKAARKQRLRNQWNRKW